MRFHRRNIKTLVDTNYLQIDLVSDYDWSSFGLAFGVNSWIGNKPDNFIITIEFIFWTLDIEIN